MKTSLKSIALAIWFTTVVAMASSQAFATSIIHVETAGNQSTNSSNWTPIQNLSLTLPARTSQSRHALLILNLPNPYATGPNYPGGQVGISVGGSVLVPIAVFTTNIAQPSPPNAGRTPTTLVIKVDLLNNNTQAVSAVWMNVRGSTVIIDTPASLTAIVE